MPEKLKTKSCDEIMTTTYRQNTVLRACLRKACTFLQVRQRLENCGLHWISACLLQKEKMC